MRWKPFPLPPNSRRIDWQEGLFPVAQAGDTASRNGLAVHIYLCNADMDKTALFNSDGDFLIGNFFAFAKKKNYLLDVRVSVCIYIS